MSLGYRYKQIADSTGTHLVPKIPMVLKGEKAQIIVMGLLDSGATNCFLNRDWAEMLGLAFDESEGHEVVGLGSKINGMPSAMEVILEDAGARKRYSGKVPVTIVENEHLDEIVIGRVGFFNLFRVTFHENEKRVVLKPYTKNKVPEFVKV